MVEDRLIRLSALRERVIRGEYEIDARAVAGAIVHRLHERSLPWALLKRVVIAREAAGSVCEAERRGAF